MAWPLHRHAHGAPWGPLLVQTKQDAHYVRDTLTLDRHSPKMDRGVGKGGAKRTDADKIMACESVTRTLLRYIDRCATYKFSSVRLVPALNL
jgi:hypothetical protein